MRWLRCSLLIVLAVSAASAQDGGPGPARPKQGDRLKEKEKKFKPGENIGPIRKGSGPLPAFTPEIEAAALNFAKEHFPELVVLLERLKAHSEKDYHRAIGELYRTSERLAQAKQRDKERYDLELQIWQTNSRIRLILAHMSMEGDSSSLREQLRAQLLRKRDLQIAQLTLERDRANRRVKNLDAEIERLQGERDQLDNEVDQLIGTVSQKKNDKRGKRPRPVDKGAEGATGEVNVKKQE